MRSANFLITLLILMVSIRSIDAQYESRPGFKTLTGINSVRGETTGSLLIGDDYGFSFLISFNYPVYRGIIELNLDFQYNSLQPAHIFERSRVKYPFTATSQQTNLGLGGSYFFLKKIQSRDDFFHPYLGLEGGVANLRNAIEIPDRFPPAYQLYDGSYWNGYAGLALGVRIRFSKEWSWENQLRFRTYFSDAVDGISGTGSGNDWFMVFFTGLHYKIFRP